MFIDDFSDNSQVIDKLYDKFGHTAQLLKCAEELSECSAAMIRLQNSGSVLEVVREVADVLITLEYFAKYIEQTEDVDLVKMLGSEIEKKLQRSKERYL
jgi:NTP pyrophosphatase (non-canonical NTP hydrolase)